MTDKGHQHRPESPTVTLTWHVKTKYVNSTKGTSSQKTAPQRHINPPFQACSEKQHRAEPIVYSGSDTLLDLENGSPYKHMCTPMYIVLLASECIRILEIQTEKEKNLFLPKNWSPPN